MSQLIYGHVAYGIVLRHDEGVPSEWLEFGDTEQDGTTLWEDGMLQHVLPLTTPPAEASLEIVTHYLRGQQRERERYKIPMLVVNSKSVQTQTSSGDNPTDFSELVAEYQTEKTRWDAMIENFVQRCKELGIEIHETEPHFILYLTWDDHPTT
jgi:hypothetical protein